MNTRLPHSEIAALVLVASVAAASVAVVTPDAATVTSAPQRTSTRLACPLTLPQDREATLAFQKMMPVLTHPRCFNCHGGVNPFKPADEGGHLGGDLSPFAPGDCRDCHNDLRIQRNGRLVEWNQAGDFTFFVGKTARELCNQFKALIPTPELFVGHMVNENGGTQFTEAAYRGDRGLNAHGRAIYREATGRDMVPEPPSMPHAELIAHAKDWANRVGTNGWKVPDCGCRLGGDAWEGTVTTVFTASAPQLGTLTEKMDARVRFELDSSFILAAPTDTAIYWKTTSGTLKWTVTMSGGECTALAGGTAPLILGGDDNPWGLIRMEPADSGRLRYSAAIGPWPDAYEPRFVWQCAKEPKIRPGFAYGLGQWWNHPELALVSADGRTIRGSFTDTHPLGTIRWVWNFTLIRRP